MPKRKAMRGFMNEAEDIEQLLEYERGFAKCGLAHPGHFGGLPTFEILMHLWWRARGLYVRYMNTLPPGPEREEITYFLEERDLVMEGLREKARALPKEVEDA
jgi:hypothetical protein